jgi:hypothetical protein
MSDSDRQWQLMLALSERILAAASATEALEAWCAEHGIGAGGLVALPAPNGPDEPIDDESRDALHPFGAAETKFRRVRLTCGGVSLVDALNWYLPAHLTAEISEQLRTTTVPFGRAIKPLRPSRRTFLIRRCPPTQIPMATPTDTVFEHRAVVLRHDGLPLAVVHERYRAALVGRPDARLHGPLVA